MTTTADPNAFLLGGGGRSAKFETVGDTVTGEIISTPELRQQTDIKDGKPKTWDNGDPMMQLVVRLQTTERDDDEDDGVRNLYISGGFKRASLQKAVADALRTAKAQGLQIGGTLAVRFTGEEPASTKGFNPAKLYAAKYTPPKAAADAWLDDTPATSAAAEEPPF